MAKFSKSGSGTKHGNTVVMKTVKILFQVFPGIKGTDAQRGIPDVPYSINNGIANISGAKTDADGCATIMVTSNSPAILKIFDTEYTISVLDSIEPATAPKGQQRRLSLLGYELGGIDGSLGKDSDRAILNFQADSDLNADGVVDNFTRNKLVADFGE